MKKIILLSICLLAASCHANKANKGNSIGVFAVADPTDPHDVQVSLSQIFGLYGFDIQPNIEAFFQLTAVTNVKLTEHAEFHLPNATLSGKRSDAPNNRKQLIGKLKSAINGAIIKYHTDYDRQTPMENSECYWTISNEILYLQSLRCSKSFVICYSNLFERSRIFDYYTLAGIALVNDSAEKVADIFLRVNPLPESLKGLTVIFVYHTKNNVEADRFLAMLRVYKCILEPRGAKVILQTTGEPINPALLYEPQQQK